MIRALENLDQKVEAGLYRRGFQNGDVRRLIKIQLYLATGGIAGGLLVLPLLWGAAFAAGAVLITINFYALAHIVQELVFVQKGAVVSLLVGFYARLILTGVALFFLIVWAGLPVGALLAGLTTVVGTILIWGVIAFWGKL
ncbi:MAG: ATP synthase subunit I [Desulfovibrionales bacterium]